MWLVVDHFNCNTKVEYSLLYQTRLTKGGDTVHKYSIDNKLTCTSSICSMFALLDCFLKKYIQQNKECKHHVKGKNEFFFARSLKFSKVPMGHLHTPVHHILN